ncbi:MAG: flagellar biosynthetic protein FliO [Bacillota bacterium]
MNFNLLEAIIRLIIFLPLVAGLAYLAVRYGLGQRMAAGSRSRNLKVLEQMPLGPRSVLSVIWVAGKCYLVSTSNDGRTSLLCPVEDFPLPVLSEEAGNLPQWQQWITRFASGRGWGKWGGGHG